MMCYDRHRVTEPHCTMCNVFGLVRLSRPQNKRDIKNILRKVISTGIVDYIIEFFVIMTFPRAIVSKDVIVRYNGMLTAPGVQGRTFFELYKEARSDVEEHCKSILSRSYKDHKKFVGATADKQSVCTFWGN